MKWNVTNVDIGMVDVPGTSDFYTNIISAPLCGVLLRPRRHHPLWGRKRNRQSSESEVHISLHKPLTQALQIRCHHHL